ncbi:MAG TPA: metallophosphoesterase [Gemmatimonadales bacterium]|nr:metallophosphoesterase [Gemmatimonadales bacterium]
MRPRRAAGAGLLALCWAAPLAAQALALPVRAGSVRFAVIGDTGTGDQLQYAVAQQLALYRQKFPFTFTIMLGDNIYGSERPQDFDTKFTKPYKPLLDAKVEFDATLGNHDDPNQRFYKPFNMGGNRYRTFKKGNVRFFVIDSNYLDPDQVKWLEKELASAGSDWKIPYFHHPLYTTAARGPEVELRAVLEPLFVKYGVDVVFSGHEHVYERLKPQKGIYYFTAGGAAKLRSGDTRKGPLTDQTFDTDRSFMLVEISGNDLYFQAISRTGKTVDKGVLHRLAHNPPAKPPVVAKPTR